MADISNEIRLIQLAVRGEEVRDALIHALNAINNNVSSSGGGASVIVDDALSDSSANPVQNAVIKTALDGKISAADYPAITELVKITSYYIDDCNHFLDAGYCKVAKTGHQTGTYNPLTETTNPTGGTVNYPSVCTGEDGWGVLFFVAENYENGTGTQMYFPINGAYKGRIFYRAVVDGRRSHPSFGAWNLIPLQSEIPALPSKPAADGTYQLLVSNGTATWVSVGV